MTRPTTYDRYNDQDRHPWRSLLVRGTTLTVCAGLVIALAGWTERARADADATSPDATFVVRHVQSLNEQLQDARGQVAMLNLQLERANIIAANSTRYRIPADLAAAIYDIALSEGIDPQLGYRLVMIESNFKAKARSSANAIGYTQLRLLTARHYQPDITERELFDRETNLRIGFRFLSDLLAKFDNDMHLALLAYNRGPARIAQILASGGDPRNGYAAAVLRGYRPTRVEPPAAEPSIFEP